VVKELGMLTKYPPVNQRIKARREQLGLKQSEIAAKLGMSDSSYADIEQHADEIFTVTPVGKVRELCTILGLDPFELFELSNPNAHSPKITSLPQSGRAELIRERREELGLTAEQLADRVGYYAKSIEAIESGDIAHLDSWVIEEISDMASELKLPAAILLGFDSANPAKA
jgi:transcriptional regulator with XRE-family HTH domain